MPFKIFVGQPYWMNEEKSTFAKANMWSAKFADSCQDVPKHSKQPIQHFKGPNWEVWLSHQQTSLCRPTMGKTKTAYRMLFAKSLWKWKICKTERNIREHTSVKMNLSLRQYRINPNITYLSQIMLLKKQKSPYFPVHKNRYERMIMKSTNCWL
jgi:hypothetical protein